MMTIFNEDRPCSVEELEKILTAPAHGCALEPSSAYDEVFDGIFIGEKDSAKSVGCMKRLGITHVLNAAKGNSAYHVNTSRETYQRSNIQFLGIEATDFINCDLSQYFQKAADFIEAALSSEGKVFVNCVQGMSRSATLVLAYLMLKHHMTVQDATRLVRSKREIYPNPGFLQQLCDLNEKLKEDGHFHQQEGEDSCHPPEEGEQASSKDPVSGSGTGLAAAKNVQSPDRETVERKAGKEEPLCTVEELEEILTEPSDGFMMMPSDAFNQVDQFVFIGEGAFARNIIGLKRRGITHVLNAAQNKGCTTDSRMYEQEDLHFLGIEAVDTMGFDISQYFTCAADFIHSAVAQKGKVYVHCVQGVSRSAALVIAYYMIKLGKSVQESVRLVRSKREICPNSSFLQQLCDLDLQLRTTPQD